MQVHSYSQTMLKWICCCRWQQQQQKEGEEEDEEEEEEDAQNFGIEDVW